MRHTVIVLAFALLFTPFLFSSSPLPPVASSLSEVHSPEAEVLPEPVEKEKSSTTDEEVPGKRPAQESEVNATEPPRTAKPAAGPPPSHTSNLAALLEEKILAFTNTERSRRNLGQLSRDSILSATARAHSADMLERDFFEHENPDGCSSSCRATNAGYAWRMIGENIYMLEGFEFSPDETAAMIVSGWMESPGHRANILREGYTDTGVGVVVHGSAIYATVLYATPQ